MSLRAGIVGLPNVGKSTLFNALTAAGAETANYPFATIEPNIGVIAVPDDRLKALASVIETAEVVPATVEIVDIAGLVRGASEGEGLGNQFLGHIRAVDAILEVVRCFETAEVSHVEGGIDPIRDIETIETELVLADLQVAERRLERLERAAKSGDKAITTERDVVRQVVRHLGSGDPVASRQWSNDQGRIVQGLEMLTARPILYVCNVDEAHIAGNEHSARVEKWASQRGESVVVLCAQAEAEIAELDSGDQREFLAELGLKEPGLHTLARATYGLLGLRTFFTAGPRQIRAWTIPAGTKASQAAGVIHSDFETGFIRAEVYRVDDLVDLGGETPAKAAGRMRVEGKDYVVAEGDVLHIRFNV